MGMATSDNEKQIAKDYARKEKLKERPRSSNTYEHRGSEYENACYIDELVKWAESLNDNEEWLA